ncbi:hypothetical protein GXW78_05530 [Roseomonas terrae]|uniref:META domain-containing protein n=1 Tax=Neoroseomonas terrae TaxID=424799 RepID=A0ABS5EDM0_9PROT|nr:hypothetical protein [Neoroseomonas terrae]MBR0649114.1 hypothetical protein [Neoroseomonas terrae]
MHRRAFCSAAAFGGLSALAGCSAVPPVPTERSIAGRRPVGTVTLAEEFIAGAGAGNGTLSFRGRSYPFRMAGTVVGPGGAARIQASGDVYGLTRIEDFAGIYTQGTGDRGLDTRRTDELWLQNAAGVIMHLRGTQMGVVLSLGRDELLIEMTGR